jgi:SAM-dependent methyltransferase
MFFSDKIINIRPGDKVLEIGPGATPYFRSDVLLEKKFSDEKEYAAQFGHAEKLSTDKPVIFYEGDVFPFRDKEFDYVICSHVIEHVEDVPGFLSEIFRVGKKGYLEYPLMYYEYLYNFDVHLNFVKYNEGKLYYMKKKDSALDEFVPVQEFFYQTLKVGHDKLISDFITHFMEGFEWLAPFECVETKNIKDLAHKELKLEFPKAPLMPSTEPDPGYRDILKQLVKRILK